MMLLLACGPTTFPEGEIPPPPDAAATTTTGTVTFALDSVLLGESDRDGGEPSSSAWKSFGYNLDGLTTTKDSTDVCGLASGSPKTNQMDGINGTDNAFGLTILPIFETVLSKQTPSTAASDGLRKGLYTLQIQIDGLPDASSPVTGMTVRAMRSQLAGLTAPAFDETTDWPVLASSLAGPTITSALWQIPDAYIADDGTFVASMSADAVLFVPLLSDFALPIHHAAITFTRTLPNHITGTIAGVILTEDLISASKSVAGEISPSLCGSAFTGIADQMRQASDILSDRTNRSGLPCDAISIGIGFTATKIANPTQVVPDAAPSGDPCTAKPVCKVGSVAAYEPAPLVPAKSIAGACTPSDLQSFFDACLATTATPTGCAALVQAGGTCTSCLLSSDSDPTLGPIVRTTTTWDFNVAGCVELVTGSSTCASSIANAEGCEATACSTCVYVGGDDPLEREQCIQQADVGGCATFVNGECDFVAAGASACRVNATDQASFRAFATVFCGN